MDQQNNLINAQEGKTKGLRHWRFDSIKEMDSVLILEYMLEAVENQKQGKFIKAIRNTTPIVIPNELKVAFENNSGLKTAFGKFPLSKQREFTDYIHSAKQDKTKSTRMEKIVPMILSEIGLYDKYNNR